MAIAPPSSINSCPAEPCCSLLNCALCFLCCALWTIHLLRSKSRLLDSSPSLQHKQYITVLTNKQALRQCKVIHGPSMVDFFPLLKSLCMSSQGLQRATELLNTDCHLLRIHFALGNDSTTPNPAIQWIQWIQCKKESVQWVMYNMYAYVCKCMLYANTYVTCKSA